LILTLTGKSNVLATTYFPAIDLSDDDYKLDLMNFETYNTISNVNASNNKFYFDENDVEITIPKGSYELHAINDFLKHAIPRIRPQHAVHDDKKRGIVNDDVNEDFPIALRANNMLCPSVQQGNFLGMARLRGWNPERNAQMWYNRVAKSLPTHSVDTDLFNCNTLINTITFFKLMCSLMDRSLQLALVIILSAL